MSDEKPLHVRVAEALGATVHDVAGVWYTEEEMDAAEARGDPWSARTVPHYDTDWAATGPLIERFGLLLGPSHFERGQPIGHSASLPEVGLGRAAGIIATGSSYLVAVCSWIVRSAEVGRLPRS